MKKILIVRPDGIGDFVLFTAVIEKYKELYSDYEIDILCHSKTIDLASQVPFIKRVYLIDVFNLGSRKYLLYVYWLLLKLNLSRYDKIIYPVYSRVKEVEWLIQRIKAKEKIIFDGNASNDPNNERIRRNRIFTQIVPSFPQVKTEIQRNAEFVMRLGANVDLENLKPKIWFATEDENRFRVILNQNELKYYEYYCLVPGAGFDIRYWNHGSWVELIRKLLQAYPHLKPVILGFGKDSVPIESILQLLNIDERTKIINLYQQTSTRVLAKILERSKFCVGMETGTIHIASAMGTPNVCIIGGGHFGRFYPYGDLSRNRIVYHKMDCYGCEWRCIYDTSKCIKDIKVEDVYQEVRNVLELIK
jgi:ADP-heptose:LPS heptosyltransferase